MTRTCRKFPIFLRYRVTTCIALYFSIKSIQNTTIFPMKKKKARTI